MEKQENYIFRLARIIAKSINGKLSEEEKNVLNTWLIKSEKNKRSYEKFKDTTSLQRKIRDTQEIDWQKDCEIFIRKLSTSTKKQIHHTLFRYAAILVIPIIITLFLVLQEKPISTTTQQTEIISPGSKKAILTLAEGKQVLLSDSVTTPLKTQQGTQIKIDFKGVSYLCSKENITNNTDSIIFHKLEVPRGGEYFLTLSDGTEVWLNAESEIRFPIKFSGEKRIVYLNGEAFFTVTPDKAHPFIVISKQAQVKVLGTAFNFRAYADEKVISTTLVSGSVVMSSSKQHPIQLLPGEQGLLDKTNHLLSKQEVNTELYTAWKDGRFIFKDARLEDLFNILARWYDLEIFYTSPRAKEVRLTGNLSKSENFNTLLKIIEDNERVAFTVNHRTVFVRLQ